MSAVRSGAAVLRERLAGEIVVDAEASVPTEHGTFRFVVFRHLAAPSKEHIALVHGELGKDDVLVRVHSECMTSEVFGSLKCDCKEQLDDAMRAIHEEGSGLVIYLRQEGRDIGLANKIRAYALQAQGIDTVDANRALGLPDDARTYEAAGGILRHLGIASVRLLTNNPEKVEALRGEGIEVRERVPTIVSTQLLCRSYLETKRARMNHAFARRNPKENKR